MKLDNIHFYFKGGGTKEQAATQVPLLEKEYPEPSRFGILPAYGFFIRDVKDLKISNVETHLMSDDARAPYILENVDGVDIQHIRSQKGGDVPTLILNKVKNFNIFNTDQVPNTRIASVDKTEL